MSNNKLAVVLIRGTIGIHPDVKKTLELLRLQQKHVCVIIDDNEVNRGMLQRVKDYVTYGMVDEAFFKEIIEKRGIMVGSNLTAKNSVDAAKVAKEYFAGDLKLRDFEPKYQLKPYFRLAPPVGGFERGGIKKPFTKGGVLGNRGDEMKTLVSKML